MAVGGVGHFHARHFHAQHWHERHWAEPGAAASMARAVWNWLHMRLAHGGL